MSTRQSAGPVVQGEARQGRSHLEPEARPNGGRQALTRGPEFATPRATVRLQLHPGFTLEHATTQVPYYASLGVSHLYLSPITCARADSLHGYDVIDHRHVDPRLGGESALTALGACVRQHDMGLILDIVPNHMAAHPDNPWWRSVLQSGPASRFARWFDIQWESTQPWLRGKVLLPVLSDMYGVALKRGDIRLVCHGSSWALEVQGLLLPLAADSFEHHDEIAVQDRLATYDPSAHDGRQMLHALLQRQHYRLAWWQCAADQINWRRFFEISDLAGLCVERDDVFDAVHELPLRLFESGLIDGLRIDHVDGLAQPLTYCRRLYQALCDRVPRRPAGQRNLKPWLIVEKILADGESLDSRWQVDGTTGYDFMEAVNTVLHDPSAEAPLTRYWNRIAGDGRPVADWRRDARASMVSHHFAAERDALLDALAQLAQKNPATRDSTRHSLGRAIDQLLIAFPVYRSYVSLDSTSDNDVRYLDMAQARARQYFLARRDFTAVRVLDVVANWLKGVANEGASTAAGPSQAHPTEAELQAVVIRRFQQLTPPLAAKAQEDTVLYRYGLLLSRNDVGSEPAVFSSSLADFHQWNRQRAESARRSVNATATHDHKRGEDVRARLAVISELPDVWRDVSTRCLAALEQRESSNARAGTLRSGMQGAQCYMLLQTIVGAWPPELHPRDGPGVSAYIQRLWQWQLKALREAKQLTSWFYPDEVYEHEQAGRIGFLLRDPNSLTSKVIARFVRRIAPAGALNSLGWVVLRCTLPGVPDLYQGTDLWDFSLVDPDNRRGVDMAWRDAMLREFDHGGANMPELLSRWQDGAVKQAVLARCLRLRARFPALFAGSSYVPLAVTGPLAGHVLAFMRCDAGVRIVVVVSRLGCRAAWRRRQILERPLIPSGLWQDTRIVVPADCGHGDWRDALSGHAHGAADGGIQVAAVLSSLPVAVLVAP